MPSVVEWVRASGLPPAAGISYALNTPDWLLVTRIARSSGENDAPTIEVVFMNCSIVYRGTGRTGRARCATAALGMALGSASSSRITRPDEGGQRTGRASGGGRHCTSRDRRPRKAERTIITPPILPLGSC